MSVLCYLPSASLDNLSLLPQMSLLTHHLDADSPLAAVNSAFASIISCSPLTLPWFKPLSFLTWMIIEPYKWSSSSFSNPCSSLLLGVSSCQTSAETSLMAFYNFKDRVINLTWTSVPTKKNSLAPAPWFSSAAPFLASCFLSLPLQACHHASSCF